MTLQEIKDSYAVSVGYIDYENMIDRIIDNHSLSLAVETIIEHENEVMKIYAIECLKLASINAVVFFNDDFAEVDKESIINEKNIIK